MIGAMPWPEFEMGRREVTAGSRLYVYSDGVHGILKPDGGEWTLEEFFEFMAQPADLYRSILDRLLDHVRDLKGAENLDDDFSILEVRF